MARLFDPSIGPGMDDAAIDEFVETVLPLGHHVSAQDLKRELPAYISEAQNVRIDHEDVQAFSDQVLRFWRGASKRNLQVPTRSSIIAHLSPFSLPPIHQQHIHTSHMYCRTGARQRASSSRCRRTRLRASGSSRSWMLCTVIANKLY